MRDLLVAALVAAASLAPAAAQNGGDAVFRGMADQFLQDFGYASVDEFDVDGFLTERTRYVPLGVYRVHMPTQFFDEKGRPKEFQQSAEALLELQEEWITWMSAGSFGDEASAQALEDAATLLKWVKKWKPSALAKAKQNDLLAALEPDPEVTEAATRFADYMGRGLCLGLEREEPKIETVCFIPDRGNFVRLVALSGLVVGKAQQDAVWVSNLMNFTEVYWKDLHLFLPLEYAVNGATLDDYGTGRTMDWRSKTGLRQQVTQIGANLMLDSLFDGRMPKALAGGTALNLVIDVWGESNTRVDGDPKGRQLDGRSWFVPGGRSEGGLLPPNMADSRWRERGSADYFSKVLKIAQKAGGKRTSAKTKAGRHAAFELTGFDRVHKHLLEGPFLGKSANPASITVPDEFFGDQLEFLRAYRAAFLHWLRTEAAGDEKKSGEAFCRMMRGLAQNDDPAKAEAAIAEAYGAPALSSPDLEDDDLETRFLLWIPKS